MRRGGADDTARPGDRLRRSLVIGHPRRRKREWLFTPSAPDAPLSIILPSPPEMIASFRRLSCLFRLGACLLPLVGIALVIGAGIWS